MSVLDAACTLVRAALQDAGADLAPQGASPYAIRGCAWVIWPRTEFVDFTADVAADDAASGEDSSGRFQVKFSHTGGSMQLLAGLLNAYTQAIGGTFQSTLGGTPDTGGLTTGGFPGGAWDEGGLSVETLAALAKTIAGENGPARFEALATLGDANSDIMHSAVQLDAAATSGIFGVVADLVTGTTVCNGNCQTAAATLFRGWMSTTIGRATLNTKFYGRMPEVRAAFTAIAKVESDGGYYKARALKRQAIAALGYPPET